MRLARKLLTASLLAAFGASPVAAQTSTIEPVSFGIRRPLLGAPCPLPGLPPTTIDPTQPTEPNPLTQPGTGIDPGAQASLAGTGGGGSTAMPQSIGDQGGAYRVYRQVTVPTTLIATTTTQTTNGDPSFPVTTTTTTTQISAGTTRVNVFDPIASRAGSGFKVGDNESPRPVDRLFFTYNGYYQSPTLGVPASTSQVVGPTITIGNTTTTTTTTTTVPGVPARLFDIHRELFGFEKTFLNGDASVEVRIPVYQAYGSETINGFAAGRFGDITVILKYALINDRETNDVFSTGLAMTVPSGPTIPSVGGNINSVLWQPFIGYTYNFGNAYVQGFNSVVIPTNSNDVSVLFTDVGVGFVAYRNNNTASTLTSIVPTVEAHVVTPLSHRSPGGLVQVLDVVSLTGGVHLGLGQQSWLTIGVNSPISAPRPYSVEGIVQFNYRF